MRDILHNRFGRRFLILILPASILFVLYAVGQMNAHSVSAEKSNWLPEESGSLADWITAAVSLVALAGVVNEYYSSRRREQSLLAQEMIGKVTSDSMMLFATTTLDWGTAIVVVPEQWRDVVGTPFLKWDYKEIYEALRPGISACTARDARRLLYRHAFVHLFNHLESMEYLLEKDSISVKDLRPLAWLVHELKFWRYAPESERETVFMPSIIEWYKGGAPLKLINQIATYYPITPLI